ncbi:hypothetical protein QJQ45_014462 [Haematococcus lacustris]|nr:hypothetical protein QJQ45_014462 [Haematococcus lacustris]
MLRACNGVGEGKEDLWHWDEPQDLACHADPAWRCAAEAVTLSCSKYEQYLYSSAGLHVKLQQLHTTLQALVRSTGASEVGAAAAAAGAPQGRGEPRRSPSSHSAVGRAVRLCDGQGRVASSTEQLRLCQLLLAAFERWGVRAHGGLSHCPDLGGAAWQTSSEAQGEERQLAEAVREAVLKLPPKQQLLHVSLPAAARATSTKYGGGEGEEEAGWEGEGSEQGGHNVLRPLLLRSARLLGLPPPRSLAGSSPEAHTTEPEAGSVGAGSGSDGSGTGGAQARRGVRSSSSRRAGWSRSSRSDRSKASGPNRERGRRAEVAPLVLDNTTVLQLLAQHPDAQLRQAVWQAGLLPRARAALALRTQQQQARRTIAAAAAAPSYAALHQRPWPPWCKHEGWGALGELALASGVTAEHQGQGGQGGQGGQQAAAGSCTSWQGQEQVGRQGGGVGGELRWPHRWRGSGKLSGSQQLLALLPQGPDPEQVRQLLREVASAERPAADAEVAAMEDALARQQGRAQGEAGQGQGPQGPEQGGLQAWDVAFSRGLLHKRVEYSQVEDHMSLRGVLQGFDGVLQQFLGLRLRPLHWPEDRLPPQPAQDLASHPTPDASLTAAAAGQQVDSSSADWQPLVWSPHVVALLLEVEAEGQHPQPSTQPQPAPHPQPYPLTGDGEHEVVGVLYLDLDGSGYGARQLRRTRLWGEPATPTSPSEHLHPAPWPAEPGTTSSPTGALPMSLVPAPGPPLLRSLTRAESRRLAPLLHGLPQVSLGLSAPWQGGRAGRLPALWELLHELGHGLHLLMAGRRCCWGQGGALGLPLELLEVPSTLCEHLLTCPASLSAICRYDPTASDPERLGWPMTLGSQDTAGTQSEARQPPLMPLHLATGLAHQFWLQHHSGLACQEQVLLALADQELNMEQAAGPQPGQGRWQGPQVEGHNSTGPGASSATAVLDQVWRCESSLNHLAVTDKLLSMLSVASHHQASFWCYVYASVLASAWWQWLMAPHPVRQPAGVPRLAIGPGCGGLKHRSHWSGASGGRSATLRESGRLLRRQLLEGACSSQADGLEQRSWWAEGGEEARDAALDTGTGTGR